MTDFTLQKNIDALITQRVASALSVQTAGATSQVTGATIQRSLIGMPMSAALTILFSTSLAAAKTLSYNYLVEHSIDGSAWTTFQASAGTGVVATGALTNGLGQVSANIDLTGANDYVRLDFTPVFSNTVTDTASSFAEMTFAGASLMPAAV